jgi:hypothetical protein
MMKLVTRAIYPFTNIHHAQKGFVPGENCIDNVYTVRKVVDHATKYGKQIWITSFDAKSAFDSGSRQHMRDCIKNLCLPDHLENIYLQSLEPSKISCKMGNIIVPTISVVNGVGQGRPESSMTFNLSIDFVIKHLDESINASYKIDEDNEIKVLAYADDIITFASCRDDAVKQTECVVEMLKLIGMEINIDKCATIAINTNLNDRIDTHLSNEYKIPIIFDNNSSIKYLGCEVSADGLPNYDDWSKTVAIQIRNLLEFPHFLPWQKMDLLRTFIISQLPYKAQIEASNEPLKIKAFSDLVTSIQQAIKSILGLQCIPLQHVYGSRPSGLACPNAQWTIINNCLVTMSRLQDTSNIIIKTLNSALEVNLEAKISQQLNDLCSSSIFHDQLETQRLKSILDDDKRCKTKRMTEHLRKQCIEMWISTKSGIAAGSQITNQSMVRKSTLEHGTQLSNSQFKALIQIRSGCVNLRTRPHLRGNNNGNINCRLCHTSMESIGHVLGECRELHGLIVKRHDEVVNILHKHLSTFPNTTVLKEQLFHVNGNDLKPDIVFLNHTSNQIVIIDPTVRLEKDPQTREMQIMEKITKYEPLRNHLANLYKVPIENIIICPLWLGARGTILKFDIQSMEKFVGKISTEIINKICTAIVSWSASIYNALTLKQ